MRAFSAIVALSCLLPLVVALAESPCVECRKACVNSGRACFASAKDEKAKSACTKQAQACTKGCNEGACKEMMSPKKK